MEKISNLVVVESFMGKSLLESSYAEKGVGTTVVKWFTV